MTKMQPVMDPQPPGNHLSTPADLLASPWWTAIIPWSVILALTRLWGCHKDNKQSLYQTNRGRKQIYTLLCWDVVDMLGIEPMVNIVNHTPQDNWIQRLKSIRNTLYTLFQTSQPHLKCEHMVNETHFKQVSRLDHVEVSLEYQPTSACMLGLDHRSLYSGLASD